MTVIAWDGNILAADKMLSDSVIWRHSTKIRRHGDFLIGLAGDSDMTREMADWFVRGAKVEEFPVGSRLIENYSEMLVIHPDKSISLYQRTPFPIMLDGPQAALGNGRDAAMAVMLLGHNAIKAVEVACQICTGCGGGIDFLGSIELMKEREGECQQQL